MKKVYFLLVLSITFFLTSCEGEQGEPGINILGQVFEVTVDFNSGNDYSRLVTFPSYVEVYESDVILVYLLEGVTSSGDDIWSQLPQTFFVPQGTLIYNFDHTFFDVQLFLYADFTDLSTLGSQFTDNQTFRIAVVPSEFATDNLSMNDLLQGLQINPTEIETIE